MEIKESINESVKMDKIGKKEKEVADFACL